MDRKNIRGDADVFDPSKMENRMTTFQVSTLYAEEIPRVKVNSTGLIASTIVLEDMWTFERIRVFVSTT